MPPCPLETELRLESDRLLVSETSRAQLAEGHSRTLVLKAGGDMEQQGPRSAPSWTTRPGHLGPGDGGTYIHVEAITETAQQLPSEPGGWGVAERPWAGEGTGVHSDNSSFSEKQSIELGRDTGETYRHSFK